MSTRPPRPRAVRTLARQPNPPGIYASSYTPELGAAICERIANGESLRSICRDDPAMPTDKTVWNWGRAHPAFLELWVWARDLARRRALAAQAERDAARRARPSMTGRRAWNRGTSPYDQAWAMGEICLRLSLGETLSAACRRPGMPTIQTFYNWLRREPGLVEQYLWARELGFEHIVQTACEGAPPPAGTRTRDEAKAMRRLIRIEQAALRRCGRLAPRRFGVFGKVEEARFRDLSYLETRPPRR